MGLTLVQVDAFTNKPFSGNPAAVCIVTAPQDERWMQDVAQEMNLSETAFLLEQEDGYNLRWFTPKVEVELCGHATLASAHVLWELGYLEPKFQARFHTASGLLTAERKTGSSDGDWIVLDFPAEPEEPADAPPGLADALGVKPLYVGKNRFDYLVQIESEDSLRALEPDYSALAQLPCRGIIVTCQSGVPNYDFVSRFFSPRSGILEDPVTGSSHCCLAPFWQARLAKDEFVAYQASPRGGVVRVRLADGRAYLGGQAVTVMRGEIQ